MRFTEKFKGIWLTVNRECNLRCNWCYAKGAKFLKEEDMTFEDACTAVDLGFDYGIRSVALIGGEPLCWPYLSSLLKYIKAKGMGCGIVSNGIYLSDKGYLLKLKEDGLTSVNFSIKADTKEGYINSTGFDVFADALNAIKNLNDTDIKNVVSFVITEDNADKLIKIAKIVKEIGVKNLYLTFCNNCVDSSGIKKNVQNPVNMVKKFVSCYDEMNNLNIQFRLNQSLPACIWPHNFLQKMEDRKQLLSVCHLHSRSGLIFDPKLRILVCNALFDFPLGQFGVDFYDMESLNTYMNSDQVTGIFKKLLRSPTKKCGYCDIFKYCAGGCVLQWFSYSYDELMKMKADCYKN